MKPLPRALSLAAVRVATLAATLAFSATPASADGPSDDANAIPRSVTIDSTKNGTVIERLTSAQDQRVFDVPILSYEQPTWSVVCVTPCRAKVDLNGVYRVGPENGVATSRAVTLPPAVTTLHVDAGSGAAHHWAAGLIVGGSVAIVSGLTTVFAANDATGQRVGFAVGGAGLLGIVVGVPMFILSATHFRFE